MAEGAPQQGEALLNGEASPNTVVNLAMSSRTAHVDEQQRLAMIDYDHSKTTASARIFRWWRSYSIEFRELSVYVWFLALYMVVVFGPSGSTMDRYQLKADVAANIHTSFALVTSPAQWYTFMTDTLVPNLYATEWTTDAPSVSDKQSAFAADGVNRRIGTVRIRLLRVTDSVSSLPTAFANDIDYVYPSLNYDNNAETSPYNVSASYGSPLLWASGSSLGSTTDTYCASTGITYPPSGYVIDLPERHANASQVMAQLESVGLLDLATRAVLVDYSVYNANTDQFAVVTLAAQFLATGGTVCEAKVSAAPLLATYRALTGDASSSFVEVLTFLEMVMYFAVLLLLRKEWAVYKGLGKERYFADGWSRVDLTNYFFFIVVMGLRANLLSKLWYLSDDLANNNSRDFISLTAVSSTYSWTEAASALNCVITFLKVFKYLRPIKKLALFTETLRLASGDMLYMCVIIAVILLAFGSSFHLAFGPDVAAYINLPTSMLSLFRATLGDFDVDALVYANYALGPLLFVLFIFLVFFVVLSMFLSIVDESYDRVRTDLEAMEALGEAGRPPLERDLSRIATEVSNLWRWFLTKITGLNFMKETKVAPANDTIAAGSSDAMTVAGGGDGAGGGAAVELVPVGAGASSNARSGGGGSGVGGEFHKRREVLSAEASPVAAALDGAFGTLQLLAQQQKEMVTVLTQLDDRVMKRRAKVGVLAEEFNSVDGGDKGRKNKY